MDLSPLKNLSPEERAALKAALDQEPEKDPLESLSAAVQYLCEEIDALKETLKVQMDMQDALKKLVMEEFIGGIADAYKANQEAEEFDGFKGKFGGMLEPVAGKFKDTYGIDLLEKAFGHHKAMMGEEGYDDTVASSELEKIVNQIKERLGIEPSAVAVKVEGSTDEEPEEDAQSAWNEIEKMKQRDELKEARRKGA